MDTPPEAAEENKPRRPLRLSVRALMVVVLILAVVLGWAVQRAKVQRDAVAAIRRTGGTVIYEWGFVPGKALLPDAQPNAPKWLVDALGVDYFGHVVLVSLGKQAGDAEMEHVGRLSKLAGLGAAGTGVTDAGAAHLRGLANLREHVALSNTKVTGACLANLRGMTGLKNLLLDGTAIADADLANLSGLTNLELLALNDTPITDAGLAHLASLVNLKQLRLGSTGVTGPGLAHLAGMSQLKSLRLEKSKVADLSSLPVLPGLRLLFLFETPIDDSQIGYLAKQPGLEQLILRRSQVTDAGLSRLVGLKESLKCLDLTGSKNITDAAAPALLALDNLSMLVLGDTKVTDATLDQLPALKNLKTFDVKGAPVSEAGLERLRKALPQMRLMGEVVSATRARNAASRPPTNPAPNP